MSQPEFDEFAQDYDRILAEAMPEGMGEDSYFASYKIALMARRHPPAGVARILDYGCGAGRSLPFLRECFPEAELWGFDVSPRSLRHAAQRVPEARLTSDWAELAGTPFDLILAANVFHHIPKAEQAAALNHCRQVLAPGGSMYVFEHNPSNPVTRRVFERCPFDADATMLSLHETCDLAKAAGLRIANRAYTLFFPRPLKALRPLEPLMTWLPLGAQYYVQLGR